MMTRKMKSRGVALLAGLAVLMGAACAGSRTEGGAPEPQFEAQLQQGQAYIFRGVDANANTGRATLSPSQFAFNPDLSTFAAPGQAPVQKQCNYRFTVSGLPNDPPHVGDSGTVDGLPDYTAVFDDNPLGHWGIRQPNGVTPDQAKQAVSAYAQANRGNVVNGTLASCN